MIILKIPNVPIKQKIKKYPPFNLSMITMDFPYFAQVLAHAVGQIKELPDFSDDKKIAVMSDFSGEHKGAHFNTYSFLILAYNKIGPFMEQVEELRRIFIRILGMYCAHKFDLVGFGKSFADKTHLDDLLSIPDFAAGVVQDLLQANKTGNVSIPGGKEKIELLKWMAVQGKFLSKITIQISKLANGKLGSGVVDFTPAKQNKGSE